MPNTEAKSAGTIKKIHVAAAVIQRHDGSILLSKRDKDADQGGLWEFPGGKLEAGETAEHALVRELEEELDIQAEIERKLICIEHDYDTYQVRLDVYWVREWSGTAIGKEGQPLAWVATADIKNFAMPAADKPIVNAILLPDTYLITPPDVADEKVFLESIEAGLKTGIKLVQYRVFGLTPKTQLALAQKVKEKCAAYSAKLMINGDIELMHQVQADGVHFNSQQLKAYADVEGERSYFVAASCHNQEQLDLAAQVADFAVLSPVLPTKSHPDADLLGWDGFQQLLKHANIPVYALGGMKPDSLHRAWASGGQGIAGIRGLIKDENTF